MNSVEKHGKSIAFALCAASFAPVAFTVMAAEGTPESAADAIAYSTAPISAPAAADNDPASDSVYVEETQTPAAPVYEESAAAAVPAASYSMKAELQSSAAAVVSEIEVPEEQPETVQVPEETETVIAAAPQVSVPEEPVMIAPASEEPEAVEEETPAAAPVEAVVMSAPAFEQAPAPVEAVEEEVVEAPVAEELVYEEPVYEEPVAEEPVCEETVYEEPVYEEQAYEEPVAEELVYEEPVYEEPVAEELVYEEPVYEQPAVEEPAAEEPVYEEPAVDETAALNDAIRNAALGLVGTTDGLQCTQVAAMALQQAGITDATYLWPDQFADAYGYYTDNPQAGNLIYYNNGGRGDDHIAVYIGDGQAVHGNYSIDGQSYTVIASADIEGAGTPQYIQVNP